MGIQINGQTDTISATDGSFTISGASGNLTGNLTGDVTGNVTGNLTGTASTATAAATAYGLSGSPTLSGITSVSTSNLTVNGNAYPSAGPLSNRNLVINGAMQVAQRSTSSVTVSNNSNENYSTVDRWLLNFNDNSGGAVSFAQSSDSPAGFANSVSITCSTTDTSHTNNHYLSIQQRIEAQNLQLLNYGSSDAVSMTLSWYMKTTTYTGPISVNLRTYDGTSEYFTVSVTPTTSWARYTLTIPGSTTATINNDTGAGMYLQFVLAGNTSASIASSSDSTAWSTARSDFRDNVGNILSSTSNAFFLTGVQLEVGSVATPFEHRSYGDELARCQRYFTLLGGSNGAYDTMSTGGANTSTTAYIPHRLPVTMRANPSLTFGGSASDFRYSKNNVDIAPSALALDVSGPNMVAVRMTGSSLTVDAAVRMFNLNTTGSLQISAEL